MIYRLIITSVLLIGLLFYSCRDIKYKRTFHIDIDQNISFVMEGSPSYKESYFRLYGLRSGPYIRIDNVGRIMEKRIYNNDTILMSKEYNWINGRISSVSYFEYEYEKDKVIKYLQIVDSANWAKYTISWDIFSCVGDTLFYDIKFNNADFVAIKEVPSSSSPLLNRGSNMHIKRDINKGAPMWVLCFEVTPYKHKVKEDYEKVDLKVSLPYFVVDKSNQVLKGKYKYKY